MASISTTPNGRRLIQFSGADGKRRTIRLGKMPMNFAERVRLRVEHLAAAAMTGAAVDPDTAQWLAGRDNVLAEKLAKVGLIPSREKAGKSTLQEFIKRYIASRTDVKPATKEVWRQGELGLVNFFGAARSLEAITAGDADGYKLQLIADKLASMTIRKRLQFAKTVFRSAVRHRLIASNPFADVSIKVGMPDRRQFITKEETAKILAVCSPDWRTIIALARFGGLRCPSEVLSLRWQDVDWETGRIMVRSPKTEHHPGKGTRQIPMFPELKPLLEEAFELAPEGAEYVVGGRYREACQGPAGWRNVNLRTQFERILARAGLVAWPRLFHNLRSSRQTELTEDFPSHVVCAWLGNSEEIAREHYLQVTDEHFDRAKVGEALQNAVQQSSATAGKDQQEDGETVEIAAICEVVRKPAETKADGEGFEPPVAFRLRQFSRLLP